MEVLDPWSLGLGLGHGPGGPGGRGPWTRRGLRGVVESSSRGRRGGGLRRHSVPPGPSPGESGSPGHRVDRGRRGRGLRGLAATFRGFLKLHGTREPGYLDSEIFGYNLFCWTRRWI